MLTIAGSGVNFYSLEELSKTVNFDEFDCIVADVCFDTPQNNNLFLNNKKISFLRFRYVRELIKTKFLEKKDILYVVTGSPLFFSAANVILRCLKTEIDNFNPADVNILPAESSKSYFLRKLKVAENEVTSISLHGRDLSSIDLTKFLTSKYTFFICDDKSLFFICDYTRYVQNDLIFYLGLRLGSEEERIEIINLEDFVENISLKEVKKTLSPYVLLVEAKYQPEQAMSDNEDFVTNAGMLTKTDKRAITLQSLELKPNLVMWDIGAGSGSVSIDAYKIFKVRTFLFEKNEQQCRFIEENLSNHKVTATQLLEGNALQNYQDIPNPDRIFIGGGGGEVLSQIRDLYDKLNKNGIISINVVGLENLSVLIEKLKYSEINYDVRSIDITNYKKISEKVKLSIAEPERTLFQVIIRK